MQHVWDLWEICANLKEIPDLLVKGGCRLEDNIKIV
jgi:hypothetical protein